MTTDRSVADSRGRADRQPGATAPDRDCTAGDELRERMLTLAYRAALGAGYSRRASRRLCREVFQAMPTWFDTHPARLPTTTSMVQSPTVGDTRGRAGDIAQGGRGDAGRRTRARLLAVLRAALSPHVDHRIVERALHEALLADELALLPPRQQQALRWAIHQNCTVAQISERTDWSPHQVIRLLHAGLRTLAVHTQPG